VAWNILGGYAGQISLGQAAFYGLGAYASTMLSTLGGWNPWLAVLAGGVLAALLSLVIGWPCFRLKGHYFAMATIAVAEIIQIVFSNWEYAGAAVGLTIPMDKEGWAYLVFAGKVALLPCPGFAGIDLACQLGSRAQLPGLLLPRHQG
jgi:branched-chain amino acid transport system permease protein